MPEGALEDLLDQAIDALLAGAPPEPADAVLASLLQIAGGLRALPAESFYSRLKEELQRRGTMTPVAARPVREGFRTVTPYLVIAEGDQVIAFLKHTFGAEELRRAVSPAGFHAEVRIGDSMLMIGSGESQRGQERIGAFHVYVPDCDAAYARALEAGAQSLGEPADRPYGERSGFVKDAAGNHWYIAARFPSNVPPPDAASVQPFLYPGNVRGFIDFAVRAFGAEKMAVFEQAGRVMHAAVRIGDAVLEMGEPEGEAPALPSRFFLYVDDCDAWYRRALAAGAVSLAAPADQPYGHRTATVLDPFGYQWVPAALLPAR